MMEAAFMLDRLEIGLQTCKSILCIRQVAGLQGAADGLEILNRLAEAVLVGYLAGVGGRRHAGYAAHACY